jgi:hypothetical protein
MLDSTILQRFRLIFRAMWISFRIPNLKIRTLWINYPQLRLKFRAQGILFAGSARIFRPESVSLKSLKVKEGEEILLTDSIKSLLLSLLKILDSSRRFKGRRSENQGRPSEKAGGTRLRASPDVWAEITKPAGEKSRSGWHNSQAPPKSPELGLTCLNTITRTGFLAHATSATRYVSIAVV